MSIKLSEVQKKTLQRMNAGEEIWCVRGSNYSFFWHGSMKTVHANTVMALQDRKLIEDYEDPKWRWRGGKFRITEIGRKSILETTE